MNIKQVLTIESLADFMFTLTDIKPLNSLILSEWNKHTSTAYSILLITKGKTKIIVEDRPYRLSRGNTFVVTPEMNLKGNDDFESLQGYKLSFDVFRLAERSEKTISYNKDMAAFPFSGKVAIFPFSPLEELAKQILACKLEGRSSAQFKQQALLQDFMFYLISNRSVAPELSLNHSLETTIKHLNTHFQENIKQEELAQMAGLNAAYFSRLFKQTTGESPTDYIATLRINRAKELLLLNQNRLKDIALHVGYSDELYFSRIFKKRSGVSPTHFIRNKPQRILSLKNTLTHHLLALGIQADTLDINPTIEQSNKYKLRKESGFEREAYIEEKVQIVKLIKPDIILCYDYQSEWRERLRTIAPVIEISWMDSDFIEQFTAIAEITGNMQEADLWLNMYQEKEFKARKQVQAYIGKEETVAIFMVYGTSVFRVYGGYNIGHVFFHSLQLSPPALIRDEMKLNPRYWSTDLSLDQIPAYSASRIMIAIQHDQASQSHYQQIKNSEHWRELSAVKNKNVHLLDMNLFLPYDPLSIDQQLDQAVKILVP